MKRVKDGVEVEVKEVLYGGTRNGKPVGGARYYMGERLYGRWVIFHVFILLRATIHIYLH